MIEAVGKADRGAGGDAGQHARGDAELHHHHRGDAAGERDGRADRKIEAAADDDEGHADGDHRHDRGLHQDVGEVERRQEAVGVSSAVTTHSATSVISGIWPARLKRLASSSADGGVQPLFVEACRAVEPRGHAALMQGADAVADARQFGEIAR